MARALGIGGVFFKSLDPEALKAWYGRWLGFDLSNPPGVTFTAETFPDHGLTVWSPFPDDTDYFAPSVSRMMINLIVDDLREALRQVAEGGAEVVGEIESHPYGDFGWFIDPDGHKVELWQPRGR